MNEKILFSEQQKFRQPWHWAMQIALLGIPCVYIWRLIQQGVLQQSWKNNAICDNELITDAIVITIIIVSIIVLMQLICLETQITDDEIRIKFFPFRILSRSYKWEDIGTASIQKINPLNHGGWGIRSHSRFKFKLGLSGGRMVNYKMYNISGCTVLQLEFNNSKTILIGTQQAKELEVVLDRIERKKKEY